MKFTILAAAAFGLAFSTAALAQNPAWVELDDRVAVSAFGQDVDTVEDWDVVNAAGQKIGEVEKVLGPDANTASALVIDFDDDAGYGDRDDLIVPIENFAMGNQALTLDIDPASTASLERWDD